MIGTGAAVECAPVDVLGDKVVRVWEVVDGSDGVVLLWLPILSEVVIVPGHAGRENLSGSYSQKGAESKRVTDFRSWGRQLETLLSIFWPHPNCSLHISNSLLG